MQIALLWGNQPPFRTVLVELRMGWNFIIGLVYMEYLTKMMRDETINKGPITIASSLATAWRGWRWTSTSLYGKEGAGQGTEQREGGKRDGLLSAKRKK